MKGKLLSGLEGALAADALAMPVHWYYDTAALDRDYGRVEEFVTPRNPHSDSILWRSRYHARNKKGEILHDHARFWGKRGVHYHQFLKAGENTLNFILALELYHLVVRSGRYDADQWLDRYIELMRTPGWNRDTYVEEYHRAFFDGLAQGKRPRGCGIDDVHIGGLTSVPFLVAALRQIGWEADESEWTDLIRQHLELTHRNREVLRAGAAQTQMLLAIADGKSVHSAIENFGSHWAPRSGWDGLVSMPDRTIVGRVFSPACYLPESFGASLALVWKYADDFPAGIIGNANCGGDNCHRGSVVGSLLGAANGVPDKYRTAAIQLIEG